MLVSRAQRRVAAIVSQKDDQRVLGNPLGFEVIHDVVETRVHAFNQCRVSLRGLTLSRIGVVRRVTGVAVEGRM